MAVHHTNQQLHFRQTGTFKPIQNKRHFKRQLQSSASFQIFSLRSVGIDCSITSENTAHNGTLWWRLYFQEQSLQEIDHSVLEMTIQNLFQHLSRRNQLQQLQNGESFINANNILVQRVKLTSMHFITSSLDYNCVIVAQKQRRNSERQLIYILDCYQVIIEIPLQDKQFCEEIFIQVNQEFNKFYLLNKQHTCLVIRYVNNQQIPVLELTDQNLQDVMADFQHNALVISNISSLNILEEYFGNNSSLSTEPLRIVMVKCELYQAMLLKVNRLKYCKYKTPEGEGKQWQSFDHKTQVDSKKDKTTPEKTKKQIQIPSPIIFNVSNKSSSNLQGSNQQHNKKNNKVMISQKNMKNSERLVINKKESNLVPCQVNYPVSAKDEKYKETGYFDQFQNLLYEQHVDQKQLALNDSFEEFEKKENSEKQQKMINELNKRKARENEQKKILDSLKQKMKLLINEEKEWIDKNFKLKIEIKKIKNNQVKTSSNKEIEDIKQKISQLKKNQMALIKELAEIHSQTNLQYYVCGYNTPQSSHRVAKEKLKVFQSQNAFSPSPHMAQLMTSNHYNNLTSLPTKVHHHFVSREAALKFNLHNPQYNFKQAQTQFRQNPINYQTSNFTNHHPFQSPEVISYSNFQTLGYIHKNAIHNMPLHLNSQGNHRSNGRLGGNPENMPTRGYMSPANFINKANSADNNKKVYPIFQNNINKI